MIGFNPDQLRHFIDFSKGTKTHSLRVAFVTRNAPSFQQPVLYPRFFFFSHTHVPWQTVARRENANHFLIKYSFFSAFHYKPRKPKSKESIWYGCKFQIKISCPNVGCTGIRWHRAETLSFLQHSWTFTSFFFLLSWLEKITREIFSSLTLRDCEETITG